MVQAQDTAAASAVQPLRRRPAAVLVLALVLAAAAVLSAGWLTALREIMYTALISVLTLALLPFIIIAAGIALGVIASAACAVLSLFSGDAAVVDASGIGAPVVEMGVAVLPRYYRWLSSRRHPAFWGTAAGTLLGGLMLWAVVAMLIMPGETRTVQTLVELESEIQRCYKAKGHYPRATQGQLTWASLGQPQRGGVVTDGFGQPMVYEVSGRGRMASYHLRAVGFDGRPGGNDMCISGATTLARLKNAIHITQEGGRVSVKITLAGKLEGLREFRCGHEPGAAPTR